MEKQLSSLKWLRERLETYRQGEKNSQSYILIPTWKLETLMVIAEEMHKEEIIDAFDKGCDIGCDIGSNYDYHDGHNQGYDYYNKTYGGNK